VLVACPPQVGKSTLAGVWTPFWWLAQRPGDRVLLTSYATNLAVNRGKAVRRLVGEHGHRYQVAMGEGEAAASDWSLASGGGMRAVGVGAGLTGHHADLLIVDDPHKDRAEAQSPHIRENVWDWWSAVGLSRLAPGAPVVLVCTRWHQDDLAGRLLDAEGTRAEGGRWHVVHLPALANSPADPLGRPLGAPLTHPAIPTADVAAAAAHWADKRATSTVRDWHALYQGDPRPAEGALLTGAQLRDARTTSPSPAKLAAVAVDPSGGGRDTAGVVGGWLGEDGRLYWATDASGVMPAEAWARVVCRVALELDADRVVVEANYGGDMCRLVVHSAWADLAREDGRYAARMAPRVVSVHARKAKLLRAEPIAAQLQMDRIKIVGKLVDLEHEWATWQPTDPASPGRIDASVHLAYALLGPPRTTKGEGGSAALVSRAAVTGVGGPRLMRPGQH
jgi:hypothetical protein